jgi:hypothetical protein
MKTATMGSQSNDTPRNPIVKPAEELTVITKTYDLILWSCNHTSRFPRNHRFVLGERIERNLYDLLETLLEANYRYDWDSPVAASVTVGVP